MGEERMKKLQEIKISRVPKGRCEICGNVRIEIKRGHYACPRYYESPMHLCDSVQIETQRNITPEKAKEEAILRLEAYCGCSLLEYLKAVDIYIEKNYLKE